MRKISEGVARRQIDSLIDEVAKGKEPVVITRCNRPFVVIRPYDVLKDGRLNRKANGHAK